MKNKLSFIIFISLLTLVCVTLSSCSNSKENGNDTVPPGQSVSEKNNWNEMNWDQNNWE